MIPPPLPEVSVINHNLPDVWPRSDGVVPGQHRFREDDHTGIDVTVLVVIQVPVYFRRVVDGCVAETLHVRISAAAHHLCRLQTRFDHLQRTRDDGSHRSTEPGPQQSVIQSFSCINLTISINLCIVWLNYLVGNSGSPNINSSNWPILTDPTMFIMSVLPTYVWI